MSVWIETKSVERNTHLKKYPSIAFITVYLSGISIGDIAGESIKFNSSLCTRARSCNKTTTLDGMAEYESLTPAMTPIFRSCNVCLTFTLLLYDLLLL
ncbi:hypothetical protein [Agarilytica rhodophyticola]|uniref:hypothetical protein n=1 Tax=Agarilytica rhodophyticola TaxID=1737490 RepID=UPI00131588CF|nr:hypothetical protein [Agarilytica rhodophyticola]